VVASDAFFPVRRTAIAACIEAGATAVIQPGGSLRDDEVIKGRDDHGIAMVFYGVRHSGISLSSGEGRTHKPQACRETTGRQITRYGPAPRAQLRTSRAKR